jgi:hypothetical protein
MLGESRGGQRRVGGGRIKGKIRKAGRRGEGKERVLKGKRTRRMGPGVQRGADVE